MIEIDIPCPECGHSPVKQIDLVDGELWICPDCAYQEITAGVDIEAQLAALAAYDPTLADHWRVTLGI